MTLRIFFVIDKLLFISKWVAQVTLFDRFSKNVHLVLFFEQNTFSIIEFDWFLLVLEKIFWGRMFGKRKEYIGWLFFVVFKILVSKMEEIPWVKSYPSTPWLTNEICGTTITDSIIQNKYCSHKNHFCHYLQTVSKVLYYKRKKD